MTAVVYHCYDSEDRLLYIGCTEDLTARMYVHECDSTNPASVELMKRIDRLEYAEYESKAVALAVERQSIRNEAPLLNTHHNLGRGMRNLPRVVRPGLSDEHRAQVAAIFGEQAAS